MMIALAMFFPVVINTVVHLTVEEMQLVNIAYFAYAIAYDVIVHAYPRDTLYHACFVVFQILTLGIVGYSLRLVESKTNQLLRFIGWGVLTLLLISLVPYIDLTKTFVK